MSDESITDRLMAILTAETDQRSRYKWLSETTGISKASWTAVGHRRQRPTCEMVEAVAKLWPRYAFWLVVGDLTSSGIHTAPDVIVKVPREHETAVMSVLGVAASSAP